MGPVVVADRYPRAGLDCITRFDYLPACLTFSVSAGRIRCFSHRGLHAVTSVHIFLVMILNDKRFNPLLLPPQPPGSTQLRVTEPHAVIFPAERRVLFNCI